MLQELSLFITRFGFIFLIYYLIINLLTLIIFRWDKRAAVERRHRINENILFCFAFVGGALGGFIAMRVYRHKTRHPSFSVGLPLFVIIHATLLVVGVLLVL